MSHTYQSCYKVTVPPLDVYHSSRRSGVRLRESCAPLDELKEFDMLYLPEQLRAEYVEREAERTQRPLPHAPGWKVNLEHELDESIARQARILNQQAEVGSDAFLNGSLASKTRYALRHEFNAIRAADGTIVHSVRYQRGANHTRRDSVARAAGLGEFTGVSSGNNISPAEEKGGLPYWMRVEPNGSTFPRSTTHATFRHIPEESFLLDQECFHGPERLAPPTPYLDSTGRPRPFSPASKTQMVKRVPLTSNHQPSLFFSVPGRLGHPELWRKSQFLRTERERERELQSSRGRRLTATLPAQTSAPLSARSPNRPLRPLSAKPITGSQTTRVSRPPQQQPTQTTTQTNASKFQQHMQQARQRWKEQGLVQQEEKEQ